MQRKHPTYEEFSELCEMLKKVHNEILFAIVYDKMQKMGLSKKSYKSFDYLIKSLDYLRQTTETECYKKTGKSIDCFAGDKREL